MMNSVNIMGRLVADPAPNYTPQGVTVLNMCLAIDRDTDRETTDFVDVLALGKTADMIANTLSKGELIGITGRLQTDTWVDRNGYKRKSTNVLISRVYFTGKNKRSQEPKVSAEDIRNAAKSEPVYEQGMMEINEEGVPW